MRKPVLGGFNLVRHTSGCVAKTECYRLIILDLRKTGENAREKFCSSIVMYIYFQRYAIEIT